MKYEGMLYLALQQRYFIKFELFFWYLNEIVLCLI